MDFIISIINFNSLGLQSDKRSLTSSIYILSASIKLSHSKKSAETANAFAILIKVGKLNLVAPRSICEIFVGEMFEISANVC